ncbi:Trk family potassium uptake protein [Cohnella sp. CFH 77786]|uniref:TrkH family potassium uptake protein n=1 Tax=Cohnella sp. CFH 77786 TaxID=2662265 RepID=UPI001C608E0B|nr:TrkH family potassium uptake protein [Cohnella sp. CFH 77786]MBW5445008.1 Trk family potassium uptake protein [Cohnella sp. CFH 77786]
MKKRSSVSRRSPQQVLVLGFALLIAAGTVLLSLPFAYEEGRSLSFQDTLFTATSAASVTGLVVADTGQTFSYFGEIVLLALIQAGGIGFMTMTTLFALMIGKKISFRDRLVLKESMNQLSTEGIVRLIRKVILYSLVIEAVGTVLFAVHWMADMPVGQALYHGLFHAVSIFNNSGFDLIGGLTPYVSDVYFNAVSFALIFLGSVGFIVLADLIDYPKTRIISLHSKVVLLFSGTLIVAGAVVIFLFEFTNPLSTGHLNTAEKALASLFQSTSLRSSGTSTLDIESLRQATHFFMVIMMFIGASPGSTGGGIKVTTFAIMLAAFVTMVRGKQDVDLFRRRISQSLVYKAITVMFVALFIVVSATIVLSFTENQPFLTVLYETTSAFGTVGFSAGLTQELTGFGKTVIMLLMFAGRLGPFTIALALQSKAKKEHYRYPEGKIILG